MSQRSRAALGKKCSAGFLWTGLCPLSVAFLLDKVPPHIFSWLVGAEDAGENLPSPEDRAVGGRTCSLLHDLEA